MKIRKAGDASSILDAVLQKFAVTAYPPGTTPQAVPQEAGQAPQTAPQGEQVQPTNKPSADLIKVFKVIEQQRGWMQQMPTLMDAEVVLKRNGQQISQQAGVSLQKIMQEIETLINRHGAYETLWTLGGYQP